MHQPLRPLYIPIPPLIKRNTTLFALSQSFMGASTQFGYGLGPLMVVGLTGSASLAGLTVALFGISRFFVAYPVGKITDTYGRKPGIQLGLGLSLVGTVIVGVAMLFHSIVPLIVGMLIFGMGFNAAQQLRVAAADMFPPQLRAMALGFVATGSIIGLLISPALIWISEMIAQRDLLEPLALPWLMAPTLILIGMVLVTWVKPDPKEIGTNLAHYYPCCVPAEPPAGQRHGLQRARALAQSAGPARRHRQLRRPGQHVDRDGADLTGAGASRHSFTAIAFSHMFHSAGMLAFTIPLGRLADRLGRAQVMYPGVATTLVGALFVTFGTEFWSVTFGTFLVGLGWSAANVDRRRSSPTWFQPYSAAERSASMTPARAS